MRDADGDVSTLDDTEIYLFDLATGGTIPLTENGDHDGNPVWSPDGRQIAFHRGEPESYHIRVMSSEGGPSVDLMEDRPGSNLDAELALTTRRPGERPDGRVD